MRVVVIGASAGIGLETVKQALDKKHLVTAFSRDTSKIPGNIHLTKMDGSADNIADLKKALADTDAAIITIGTKNKKSTTLFSDTARSLMEACKEINYQGAVLVVSGFGTGNSYGYASFFIKAVISIFLKNQYKDKTKMEEIIAHSNINWEFIKPGILSDKPLSRKYKIYPELKEDMHVGKISRADVADYLIQEAEERKNLKHFVAITNL